MAHLDGHCATPAETIYVQSNSACNDTASTAGTSGQPFCSMQPVPTALSPAVDLVVVRGTVQAGTWTFMGQGAMETSIVGQQSAFIAAGASPAFSTQSGSIYLRGLKFTSSSSVGINATGGRLRMDRSSVLRNASGGIATLNAAFDIVNTVVASNMGGLAVSLGTYSGTGPTHFAFNTIVNNVGVGVFCGQTYTMTRLLANGNQVSNISPMCVVDSTTSTDAPLFDSARPYRLTATSPCVDKGGTIGFPPDDIDGDARPQGSAADCGADEYKPQ